MRSAFDVRKVALIVGAAAILTSGGLSACAKEKPAETKPSTSAAVVSETEKASFAPKDKAKPAPNEQTHNQKIGQPGNH